jgi:hypothetical protein
MTEHNGAIDVDVLDAIEQELRDRHTARVEGEIQSAAEQAITSAELAETITGEDAEANPKTREAMKILMRERDIPLVSNNNGNWIPVNDDAVQDKMSDLDARIAGIEERKDLLADNWSRWRDDAAADGGTVSIPQAVRECIGQGTVDRDTVVSRAVERTDAGRDEVTDHLDQLEQQGFVYESGEGLRLP